MIEREVLWYRKSEDIPEIHNWNFLVINKKDKIQEIEQNLFDQLKPIIEERVIDEELIPHSKGLHYKLFTLITARYDLDFSKVYQGKIRKDRRLEPKLSSDGWNGLIKQAYNGQI